MSEYSNVYLELAAHYVEPPAIIETPERYEAVEVRSTPRGSDAAAW